MKRKPSPQWPCPFCGRLCWTYADAILCADLNVKDEQNKARKLRPVTDVDKLSNKELNTLTKSNKIT